MATYKKVSEIVKALETRIPDSKISYREGAGGKSFGYVPWDVSFEEMNRIFGVFGWGETNLFEFHDTEKGIYSVTKQIHVHAIDDETGVVVTTEKVGKGRTVNTSNPDMAVAAADSDAFSRAVKKLGDAFGIFLYDKADPAREQSGNKQSSQPRTDTRQTAPSQSNGEGRPTEKMQATLKKAGAPESLVDSMSFGDAKAAIDKVAKNGWKWDASFGPAPAKKSSSKPAAKPPVADEPDELDDWFNN